MVIADPFIFMNTFNFAENWWGVIIEACIDWVRAHVAPCGKSDACRDGARRHVKIEECKDKMESANFLAENRRS